MVPCTSCGIQDRPQQHQQQDEQWRKGEHGVVGKRRGHRGAVILHEVVDAFLRGLRASCGRSVVMMSLPCDHASLYRRSISPRSRTSASSVATSSPRASLIRCCWLWTNRRYGAIASFTRSVDWEISWCTWRVSPSRSRVRRSPMRCWKSLIACRRFRGMTQNPPTASAAARRMPVTSAAAPVTTRRHQGAESDRARLRQRGGGEGALHLVRDRARLGLAVVAAHDLARHPPHRLEQRLPVVAEAGGHLAQHLLLMLREAAAVHEAVHVLPDLEVPLDDPVDDAPHLGLDLLRGVGDDLALERALHGLAVEQRPDPPEADGLLEETDDRAAPSR